MSLGEFISRREQEEGINEMDANRRDENLRRCVNFVFEYFNNVLATAPEDNLTPMLQKKVDKYKLTLKRYSPEIKDWLIANFVAYQKQVDRPLKRYISHYPYFLLYDTDAELRQLSYDIYAELKRELPFLDGQAEMIFQFIKEYHEYENRPDEEDEEFKINNHVDKWIHDTQKHYGVSILNFCGDWLNHYMSSASNWPPRYKRKIADRYDRAKEQDYNFNSSDPFYWEYLYRNNSDPFNISRLYREMPKKEFTNRKKKYFETVLMYTYLVYWGNDRDNYWPEYLKMNFPDDNWSKIQ